jgi:histidinol dehydrogenase
LIVADSSANPAYVAADLLSQAEHDEDAVPILVTPDAMLAEEVGRELEKQVKALSKKAIAEVSLDNNCFLLITKSLDEAMEIANEIAPEHLELSVENPSEWVKKVNNAGAIFMGHYTPEAMGDYLAGPNHVLPTSGTARFSSPLGVYDFIKRTSLISYTREELQSCGKTVIMLAEMEDLGGHANSVKLRLEGPDKKS